MYVTRPLSLFKSSPSALSSPPPDGPNSGILVVQDLNAERSCCFSARRNNFVIDLPFPQNRKLNLEYLYGLSHDKSNVDYFYGLFIPVLNQPPSSNQYYVVQTRGRHAGKAYTSSSEEEKATFCCCKVVRDVPPKLFDPNNRYQQFEINTTTSFYGHEGLVADSMAADGVPPFLFRRPGWTAHTSKLPGFESMEAPGLDSALRARFPAFDFPLPCKSSEPVVVGKWYCPFIFIREGAADAQMRNSTYYEMTLEQRWEEIFGRESSGEGNGVDVDVDVRVEREVVSVAGETAAGRDVGDGVVWFGRSRRVGLSLAIVERMKWEEERGGFEWVEEGGAKEVKVKRREKFKGMGKWRRFGCYVLVERFVLKRMDGSLLLTWDFRHTRQIRTKWE